MGYERKTYLCSLFQKLVTSQFGIGFRGDRRTKVVSKSAQMVDIIAKFRVNRSLDPLHDKPPSLLLDNSRQLNSQLRIS